MAKSRRNEPLPIIPLRDMVVFPGSKIQFVVGRPASVEAVRAAATTDREVALVMQRDAEIADPALGDLHAIGTRGRLAQQQALPEGNVRVLVEGLERVRLLDVRREGEHLVAAVEPVAVAHVVSAVHSAARGRLLAAYEEHAKLRGGSGADALQSALGAPDPTRGCDDLVARLQSSSAEKQQHLETLDGLEALASTEALVRVDIERMKLDQRLQRKVQSQVEKAQKEYLLNEKMKAIQVELGRKSEPQAELAALEQKIEKAHLPKEAKEKAEQELKRLEAMPPVSAEATVARSYLDWLLAVPWRKRSRERVDFEAAGRILNEDHHGLEKVKERILEFLAVRRLKGGPASAGPILCFVGPPGVGKTSLGRSIAKATGREFVRLSLGGVRDEAEIRGHRRTYIGAYPGRIIQQLRRAGTKNPVFLLDEIDKLASDFRGDPASALLEVLDPAQNSHFLDHYLDVEFDLSEIMFICTANVLQAIPPALRDRLEVIRLPGYTLLEKLAIAERFLLPRQREENGLHADQLVLSTEALREVVEGYTREAGVRNLERELASLARKAATRVVRDRSAKLLLGTPQDVRAVLGVPRFRPDLAEKSPEVGVATGLAWTETGGQVLLVEATEVPGKGKLLVTGQLGDVMQESLQAALSYVRSRAAQLGLHEDFFRDKDVHVHLPEGAIPKDGPSAGITLATAVVSALTGRAVRHDLAMTGEITLRGRVLPVGGIKEKLLAAHRAGLRSILVPADNLRDLEEVPAEVRSELDVSAVSSMDEVLAQALLPAPAVPPSALAAGVPLEGGAQA